ncbi:MAG: ATP-binding cassette domain-containing protein, partial [Candidatus Aminicenantes bacterium]|nr:ATP-binding cassette domain-containing protein [Candidatus Aminicenantes bacterium]
KSLAPGRARRRQEIIGSEFINKVIEIDQAPIGRTPRSNPATYTKLFDLIRDIFAALPESRQRGWDKGRFSFNVKGGRCDNCEGAGLEQIGMHFLGDVEVTCPECSGRRFNDETLQVEYKGKNIYDVLEMQIDEAYEFFKEHEKISRYLQTLKELGLGYIALGQSSTTLSGGEAQRIKLAAELCRPAAGRTLYILDEPTTGLHAADIKVLLACLNSLIDKGHTVITVVHHPDFIKTADWIIDLGPESGSRGGELVACGTPEEVARNEKSFTGAFLRKILNPAARGADEGPPGVKKSGDFPSIPGVQKSALPLIPSPRGEAIRLKGVRTHNLKHIDVEIPIEKLTVITGVSGSGKSSLAFDTIFAAGQQAFLSGFSTYARRLLVNKTQADMESCSGLTPTIAVSRGSAARNPRSTVGTMTEIYDYYRLLFARVGNVHCPRCGKELESASCPQCEFKGEKTLSARMFSFNNHQGACVRCKGLGVITVCDPRKLVTHPELSLLSGALDGSKTGKFYGDPFGRYTATLQEAGKESGCDFSPPWVELSEDARKIAMYGTGGKEYRVTWKFKRKNRQGEHEFTSTWAGFVNYVNEEYERKHDDKRGDSMLPLLKEETCPQCRGNRLKDEFLSVYFGAIDIAGLCRKTVKESIEFFENIECDAPGKTDNGTDNQKFFGDAGGDFSTPRRGEPMRGFRAADKRFANQKFCGGAGGGFSKEPPARRRQKNKISHRDFEVSSDLRREILRRLSFLQDMGLDYLTLERRASSLSGGEAQRIRLAGQLGSGLTGVTYVLDEPTIGLHSRDTQRLITLLQKLRDLGNTVIVVEHDADIMYAADHIIDLGPGPGKEGGRIVACGTAAGIAKDPASITGKYLQNPHLKAAPPKRRPLHEGIKITGACANNLTGFDIEIPRGGIIVLTGVSGSGKSTLLFQSLAASAAAGFPIGCSGIDGLEHFSAIVTFDQQGIGTASSSTAATYTGLFDSIRDLFARSETARARGYKKNRFSFNVKGGRCETCRGTGEIRTAMDFLTDVRATCPDCKGKRYNNDTLACKYKEKNIAEVLNLTVHEAVDFFSGHQEICFILEQLAAVGLGYLQLGQPADTLSSGEAQRLKLAAGVRRTHPLSRSPHRLGSPTRAAKTSETGESESRSLLTSQTGNLYLFDEPGTGLHFEDVGRLLILFNRLVEAGHTIVIIEHHPDIIKSADWIIDLGPEGGERGGRVLGSGTPEHIAKLSNSPTGEILAFGDQKPF